MEPEETISKEEKIEKAPEEKATDKSTIASQEIMEAEETISEEEKIEQPLEEKSADKSTTASKEMMQETDADGKLIKLNPKTDELILKVPPPPGQIVQKTEEKEISAVAIKKKAVSIKGTKNVAGVMEKTGGIRRQPPRKAKQHLVEDIPETTKLIIETTSKGRKKQRTIKLQIDETDEDDSTSSQEIELKMKKGVGKKDKKKRGAIKTNAQPRPPTYLDMAIAALDDAPNKQLKFDDIKEYLRLNFDITLDSKVRFIRDGLQRGIDRAKIELNGEIYKLIG